MVMVRVLCKCQRCDGEAYLPECEDTDYQGNKYVRHKPCPVCEGSGTDGKWIELPEFLELLEQAKCSHEHVTTNGGFHLTSGDLWDNERTVCSDCNKILI